MDTESRNTSGKLNPTKHQNRDRFFVLLGPTLEKLCKEGSEFQEMIILATATDLGQQQGKSWPVIDAYNLVRISISSYLFAAAYNKWYSGLKGACAPWLPEGSTLTTWLQRWSGTSDCSSHTGYLKRTQHTNPFPKCSIHGFAFEVLFLRYFLQFSFLLMWLIYRFREKW